MQNALLNLTMLGFLFLLFATMLRGRQSRRLRLWSFVWLLLFLHGALALSRSLPPMLAAWLHIVHFVLLIMAGAVFLVSHLEGPVGRRLSARIGLAIAIPWVIISVLVMLVPDAAVSITVCVLVAQALAARQARRIAGRPRRFAILALCGFMTVLMLMLVHRHAMRIPEMAIAEILQANAILLWTTVRRDGRVCRGRTLGTVVATAGLAVWASLFPLAIFFGELLPRLVLTPLFWDLPQFFIGFGMLMILQEDDTLREREQTETYRLLFDRHPLPMWVFHAETLRFLMVNEAAVAHYGYTREQFAAMTILDIRPEEDLDRLKKILDADFRILRKSPGWKHILADGNVIAVDIFSHTITFERQPARIVVAIDVTARNAAEEKLRRAYKLESLGQLTGGVAHDFNNILAIIMGNLELIEQKKMLDVSGERWLHHAMASVSRGAELTRRLLAYAMQQPLEPRSVAIPPLLEEAVRFIQSSLGPTIDVQIACDPLLWNAQIDPGQLENSLLSLAVNARDAMSESGELKIHCRNLHLETSEAGMQGEIAHGEYVVISLSDDGAGMPDDVIQRATEPFFTTKPVGKGTGLGLSMVYGFLKQSGGHMQIESRLHAGTTVSMYLPRAAPSERRAAPRAAGSPAEGLPRGKEQILVVEDEHAIRAVLVHLLRTLGYTVLEAEDGPGALRHLQAGTSVDLLLTDVVLPNGISGGALAADAKALRPEIKVLFSSGYTRNVLIRDRRLEEGVHLLTKPFRLAELATTVRRVLDVG
jgi:PAS domain S-box-containing protein